MDREIEKEDELTAGQILTQTRSPTSEEDRSLASSPGLCGAIQRQTPFPLQRTW